MSERRKFSRITFAGNCSISAEASGETETWSTEILDISLKGALVLSPGDWKNRENVPVQLNLQLEGSDIVLEIGGVTCHYEEGLLGIKFLTLSLESISHLKRLVQLNLADENLLHREMSQLINIDD
ncbi:PilZ domain-containing protein [Psychromonas aquimarina]|uniref:PilZ domain-containing protein n=1 Tax=Psychromonas aquimarina TaxID=444919 RepID=UPI0004018FC5|nr:PilZ domain-containing protein [Psychromonas aquimarina]